MSDESPFTDQIPQVKPLSSRRFCNQPKIAQMQLPRHSIHACTGPSRTMYNSGPHLVDDERAVPLHLEPPAPQLQRRRQARNQPRILRLLGLGAGQRRISGQVGASARARRHAAGPANPACASVMKQHTVAHGIEGHSCEAHSKARGTASSPASKPVRYTTAPCRQAP